MRTVNILVREIPEVYALAALVRHYSCRIRWVVSCRPYNSDLLKFGYQQFLSMIGNVEFDEPSLSRYLPIGFRSDISDRIGVTGHSRDVLPLTEIIASFDPADFVPQSSPMGSYVVVSNVKIGDKNPSLEHDIEMWSELAKFPVPVAVVPRHPCAPEKLKELPIPGNVTIINEVGILRGLCLRAKLVIMGLLFSPLDGQVDHNPLEATMASHALFNAKIAINEHYRYIYNNPPGLLHPVSSYRDLWPQAEPYLSDSDLLKRLATRLHLISVRMATVLEKMYPLLIS